MQVHRIQKRILKERKDKNCQSKNSSPMITDNTMTRCKNYEEHIPVQKRYGAKAKTVIEQSAFGCPRRKQLLFHVGHTSSISI